MRVCKECGVTTGYEYVYKTNTGCMCIDCIPNKPWYSFILVKVYDLYHKLTD